MLRVESIRRRIRGRNRSSNLIATASLSASRDHGLALIKSAFHPCLWHPIHPARSRRDSGSDSLVRGRLIVWPRSSVPFRPHRTRINPQAALNPSLFIALRIDIPRGTMRPVCLPQGSLHFLTADSEVWEFTCPFLTISAVDAPCLCSCFSLERSFSLSPTHRHRRRTLPLPAQKSGCRSSRTSIPRTLASIPETWAILQDRRGRHVLRHFGRHHP